ncbi:MAG: hypothetical protein JWQ43_336 [Glaciihabitans sp.]|nr:hypothetical protein [Glaciihabitans sp.]
MTSPTSPPTKQKSPLALRITFALSVIAIFGTALGTVVQVIGVLLSESASNVVVPVQRFWPMLNPGVEITDGPTAEVVGGGFTSAELRLDGLSQATRFVLAGGYLVQGITVILVAIAVGTLCSRLGSGTPFSGAVTRSVRIAAASIIVGGLAWQVLLGIGGLMAADEALAITGWNTTDGSGLSDTANSVGWPVPGNFSLDFWPVWLGLALLAVAAAFRYGEKLQRERETLQADNARLARDTDGLV